MKMQTFIRKILDNDDYRNKKRFAYDNYGLFQGKINLVDEIVFLEFIERMQKDDALVSIYRDIDELLLIEDNVTDKIFNKLVLMAKSAKFSWMLVGLCHASLSIKQQDYLKTLNLNDAYYY